MPGRRTQFRPQGGGGGGGGSAVVRWGPNFGTPGGDSLPQKSTLVLTRVEEIVALGQVHTLGGQLRAAYTSGPGQVHTLGGTIGPSYSGPGQAQAIRHAQLALAGALGQVQSVRHTALALSGGVAQVQAIRHPELALSGGVAQVQATRHSALALAGGIAQVQSVRHPVLGASYAGPNQVQALAGKARGAPFWQSVGTKALATTLGATQIVANMPSGIVAGDLLVAWVSGIGAVTVAAPTGWTLIVQADAGGGGVRGAALRRVADGTEGATQTFVFSGTPLRATAEVHRINGVDTANPINVFASGGASVIDPIIPAVTTTVTNCLVFALLSHQHTITQNHGIPASHIERTEFVDTNVQQHSSSSYTRVFAAAADTGTATVDCGELAAAQASYARVAIAPGDLVF